MGSKTRSCYIRIRVILTHAITKLTCMCFYFAKTEIRLDFKCVLSYSYIKKLPITVKSKFYGFVMDKLSTMTKP